MKSYIKDFEGLLVSCPLEESKKEEFKKKLKMEEVNVLLRYDIVDEEIFIPEKCFRYHYIIKNNIYKKYENKIKNLLNIIFSSDLIKQLFEGLFNLKDRKMKYFFNGKDSIEELWNNIILFIPFKLTGISGFSYRHILKIFISIYMICHFNTEIENEIFNLGAFVRVIIHEIMGHFFISYRYFMFFANIY